MARSWSVTELGVAIRSARVRFLSGLHIRLQPSGRAVVLVGSVIEHLARPLVRGRCRGKSGSAKDPFVARHPRAVDLPRTSSWHAASLPPYEPIGLPAFHGHLLAIRS